MRMHSPSFDVRKPFVDRVAEPRALTKRVELGGREQDASGFAVLGDDERLSGADLAFS
jgi:hypothetical protein